MSRFSLPLLAALLAAVEPDASAQSVRLRWSAPLLQTPNTASPREVAARGAGSALRLSVELRPRSLPADRPPAPDSTGTPEGLVVSLTINGLAKDDRIVYRQKSNDFLLKFSELEELIPVPAGITTVEIDGDRYALLNALPGASLDFDEKALTLKLLLPAAAFEKKTYSLARGGAPGQTPEAMNSALLNYRVGYAGGTGRTDGIWSLAAEEDVTLGRWLVRNQSYHRLDPHRASSLRYETQLVQDDLENRRRLVLGDAFTQPGELGAAVPIGGLSLSKAYQLSPYFIRQPAVNFAGSAPLPSNVDFYVGDSRVLHQQVSPGPFEISNFNYYGGQRNVRVVVRDLLGREQTFAYPFYFADQGLARGLHDYSYHLGSLREHFGSASNDYGPLAVSAFHRYGLTDSLTVGLRGEGTQQYGNLGPGLVYRSNRFGVLAVDGAGSWNRAVNKGGYAYSIAHSYQAGDFSAFLALHRFSGSYALLHTDAAIDLPRYALNLAFTYSPRRLGSLSVGYGRMTGLGAPAGNSLNLGYSRTVLGRISLLSGFRQSFGRTSGRELFLDLLYQSGGGHTISTAARVDDRRSESEQIQFSNTVPNGEGLAYRLDLDRNREGSAALNQVAPAIQYNTRYSTLTAEVNSRFGSSAGSDYAFAAAGSLAAVGGQAGFSRPIRDSFGIAEISPPIANVRVYQNSQEIGRTDANGRLLLPAMTSFIENYVSLNDKDIPIDYSIDHADRAVAPSFRGGALVRFNVTHTQSIVGALKYRTGGRLEAIEYRSVTLDSGGVKQTFLTGKDGDFYLENLTPGRHAASLRIGTTECNFVLAIPETGDAFITLDNIIACDVAP